LRHRGGGLTPFGRPFRTPCHSGTRHPCPPPLHPGPRPHRCAGSSLAPRPPLLLLRLQVGVLTYELLVGCPPFYDQTKSGTENRIRSSVPAFPAIMTEMAKDFVSRGGALAARRGGGAGNPC
jgi:hypothetical protein